MNAIVEDIWKILHEVAESKKETDLMFKDIAARFKDTDAKFKDTDAKFKDTDATFKDTDAKFKDTDAKFKDTDAKFKDTDAKFKDTDAKFKDTDAKFKDTDAKFKDTDAKFKDTDAKFKETDLQLKESDLKFKEAILEIHKKTEREIEKVNVIVGRLGNKLGDFVEEMVRPAAVRLFRERGIEVHEVHQNIVSQRGEEGIEIDLLVVNDTDIVAIECKSTLGIDDVNEHLERLTKVKRLLPTYNNKRVYGAVTGMVIPDNVARYAYKKGLFIIAQSGDQLLIRNDAKFIAKVW